MNTSSKKSKIKVLMATLKELTLVVGASDKEVSYSKEVYSEIKILYLKESAISELEKKLEKSKATMSEDNAILGLKIRISNLIQSTL
jgi:hypothetical protein